MPQKGSLKLRIFAPNTPKFSPPLGLSGILRPDFGEPRSRELYVWGREKGSGRARSQRRAELCAIPPLGAPRRSARHHNPYTHQKAPTVGSHYAAWHRRLQ
jgi:hypothetical protein